MTQSHTLKQPWAIIFAHPKFRYEYLRVFQVCLSHSRRLLKALRQIYIEHNNLKMEVEHST